MTENHLLGSGHGIHPTGDSQSMAASGAHSSDFSPEIRPYNCLSREVSYIPRGNTRWREIIVNTGGSPSPLQEIKLPESAGGYCYQQNGKRSSSCVRNRFIYWRVHHDVLELSEMSMDFDLTGNCVRYRFADASVLYGVSVHESSDQVLILVATVSSVHKLFFQHPQVNATKYGDVGRPNWSIFVDASVTTCQSHSLHTYLTTSGLELHTSATCYQEDGTARFAMATNTSSILVVSMNRQGRGVVQQELKHSTVMQRLWTGLVPSVIRGSRQATDIVLSLCFYTSYDELLIYTICKDNRIRIWSTHTQECVMAVDIHEFIPSILDTYQLATGVGGHQIRVSAHAPDASAPHIGIFLSFADHSKFCILVPVYVDRQHRLQHVATIAAPDEDLVDYCLTNGSLSCVWTNNESDTSVRIVSTDSESKTSWNAVHLEMAESSELIVPSYKDPSEAYIEAIFAPGRFSVRDIIRALNIYRGNVDTLLSVDDNVNPAALRDEVASTLQNQIACLCDCDEVPEDDYYNLQVQQWGRFYSSCVHYHQVGVRTLGLFQDSATKLAYLVKKESISVLRPCDVTEMIWLSAPHIDTQQYLCSLNVVRTDVGAHQDVIALLEVLAQLDTLLSAELLLMFDHEVHLGEESLDSLARQLVPVLDENVSVSGLTVWDVMQALHSCTDPVRTVSNVLDVMDVMDVGHLDEHLSSHQGAYTYRSDAAVAILCCSTYRLVETRLHLLRHLLLVQTLVINHGEQAGVSKADCLALSSLYVPRTCALLQTYYALRYLFTCKATYVQSDTMDSNLLQLAALDLSGRNAPISNVTGYQDYSVAELFMRDVGCDRMAALMSLQPDDSHPSLLWTTPLDILWPTGENTSLYEYMIQACQYGHLTKYLSLLPPGTDQSARCFVKGQCCLNSGDPDAALSLFLEAANGVRDDPFINNRLLMQVNGADDTQRTVVYYLKVIKLLEQFQCPILVIQLTDVAVESADEHDPNLPQLWSKKFKHLLELERVDEAYNAMISNPDHDSRNLCLRQFIVVLCERQQLQALVQFPYMGIYDDVISILESRARTTDVSVQRYYDLLHAFHVYRGNYRKAACVQYEQSLRLSREVHGLKGLQKQAKCYLATMNALRLVTPEYAWIAVPVSQDQNTSRVDGDGADGARDGASPKRDCDDNVVGSGAVVQKIQVVELEQVERQYVLLHARLKLIQKDQDHQAHVTGVTPSADEMSGLLANAGLYDAAVRVCCAYKLHQDVVFDSLTSRCIWLSQGSQQYMVGDNEYTSRAWAWLSDNLLDHAHSAKEISAVDQAWRLLQTYLVDLEADNSTRYHRCICCKLLAYGYTLPGWLLSSYKKRNLPELLRLYMTYNCLEEAASTVLEYVAAVLGNGKEYFGLETSLHYSAPAVSLPYTCIDQLMWTLKDTQVPHLYILYKELETRMDEYFHTLRQVSQDKIDAALANHTRLQQDARSA